ncbi:T9SS type A sorting domain-containing protein [bacterium]|nr:T9SS type A sorting domain-containing protein [bacterium]
MRKYAPILLATALSVVASGAFAAAPTAEPEFRALVRQMQQDGEVSYEEAMLLRFERVFAPEDLPAALRSDAAWPAKSATALLLEYTAIRSQLAPHVVDTIDGLLEQDLQNADSWSTAHLRFSYRTTGPDAVPADDLDANGVPDFVERVGAWGETAWAAYVDAAGFPAPFLRDGLVDVSFREMSAYGYTHPVDGVTALVLHRSFEGFPQNRDPEGSVFGAAKVTVAHELKHASQYAASGWTEPSGWLEADATWAEDFVFDATDDYLRYLPYGSPVSHPDHWMPASYEDCLWQHCVAQAYGVDALVDYFARRAAVPTESVMQSFDHVLRARGTDLTHALTTLGVWSYFSGANAPGRPAGFADADLYPTPPLHSHLHAAGDVLTDRIPAMATHLVLALRDGRTGRPSVSFVGERTGVFALTAIVTDLLGRRAVWRLPMVSPNSGAAELPMDWEDVAAIVVLATNGSDTASSGYSLTLNDQGAVGVDEGLAANRLSLEPARPNPFRVRTTIAFSLPAPRTVQLSIYDVGGRLIRQLHAGSELPAGPHQIDWDGHDHAGRAAAPGVYYYRLSTGLDSATKRMLLLR